MATDSGYPVRDPHSAARFNRLAAERRREARAHLSARYHRSHSLAEMPDTCDACWREAQDEWADLPLILAAAEADALR